MCPALLGRFSTTGPPGKSLVCSLLIRAVGVCECLVASVMPMTLWTIAHQAPLSVVSPSKNTGMGCHFPLQRIFLTQGLNPHLQHWQADSFPLSHMGNQFDVHIINVVNYAVWKIPINKQKLITAFWPIATKTWASSCFGVGLITVFVLHLGM